jgi:hypothetical protein
VGALPVPGFPDNHSRSFARNLLPSIHGLCGKGNANRNQEVGK